MECTIIVRNDIHIDNIMDYISPAICSDTTFRTMWAAFEWENKVILPLNSYSYVRRDVFGNGIFSTRDAQVVFAIF